MKLIFCTIHGTVGSICTDSVLLKYKCPDCLQLIIWNEENEKEEE